MHVHVHVHVRRARARARPSPSGWSCGGRAWPFAALQLLAPDVRIFESGYSEDTRDGYAANGHLDDDMHFAAGTVRAVQQRHIVSSAAGDLTCIMLIANIRGKYQGQPVNLVQSETMLLQHEAQGWRIVHIQWSGHSAQN